MTSNTYKNSSALLLELNNTQLDNSWLLDNGATHHVCKYKEWFDKYKPIANEIIYSTESKCRMTL